mmetsp:Transcript_18625/g.74378  ORF Transcript_18625/g.74378 Transcript_18625/m.74378 type:complete len:214 (-) Transcript_18625:669-1310(-)
MRPTSASRSATAASSPSRRTTTSSASRRPSSSPRRKLTRHSTPSTTPSPASRLRIDLLSFLEKILLRGLSRELLYPRTLLRSESSSRPPFLHALHAAVVPSPKHTCILNIMESLYLYTSALAASSSTQEGRSEGTPPGAPHTCSCQGYVIVRQTTVSIRASRRWSPLAASPAASVAGRPRGGTLGSSSSSSSSSSSFSFNTDSMTLISVEVVS